MDELNINVGARGILLHEMGHALGMEHQNDGVMQIMCDAGNPCSGKYGPWDSFGTMFDSAQSLHPDDANFGITMHHDNWSAEDVAVSPWLKNGSTLLSEFTHPALGPTFLQLCRGDSFTAHVSIGFPGRIDIPGNNPYGASVVLSSDDLIAASDIVASSWNVSGSHGVFFTPALDSVVPPGTPPGHYTVGFLVDPDNLRQESWEGNNGTRLNLLIEVQNCGP